MNIETVVAILSILGTLAVAGRVFFRTEALLEAARDKVNELAKKLEEAEKALALLKNEHGTVAMATSKDVDALKRDVDRLAEAVQGGMKDLSERVHALALAVKARGKDPRESA
jgi:hypothetical protein